MPAHLESVHDLLDDVAAVVGAPALLEDPHHLVVAYSRHDDPGEPVRAATILGRRAAPPVATWLAGQGIAEATGPVRLPANPELGMRPRVCLPLRAGDRLLGYLWFIDEDGDMSAFDLERATGTARALVGLLRDAEDLPELARVGAVQALLRGELADDAEVRRLLDTRLEHGGSLRVLALRPCTSRPSARMLRRLLGVLSDRLAEHAPVAAVVEDLGAMVVAEPPGDEEVTQECRAVLGSGDPVVVGLSDPVREVLSLPLAWDEARDAARCAQLWPRTGPVVDWPRAGLYRLVPDLARQDGPTGELVRRLQVVAGDPDREHLTRTAETYLDLAAHVQEAAQALVLHRTTLYHRLQRFADVSGLDLRRGENRALAHLALKAARFARADD